MSAEIVRQSAATPADDTRSAPMINEILRNQQESKETLQNMMQALSKSTLNDITDSRFDQHSQTEALNYEVATSAKPLNTSIDGDVGTEKNYPLSMTMTRTGKALSLCSPDCSCNCHIQTVFKTPQLLQQITGLLLLGYSGRFILRQQCISSCLRKDPKPLQMTYFFPRWFVSRAISFSMSNTMQNTPTLVIKFRRVVPEASPLFSLSKFGDVEGIKTLFENRLASPDDVHIWGGWTALHVSTFSISHPCIDSKLTAANLRWIMVVWIYAICCSLVEQTRNGKMRQGCKRPDRNCLKIY